MSASQIEPRDLTADEAEECIAGIRQAVVDGGEWIAKALNGRAWIALGYESWDAMCVDRLEGVRLSIPMRRDAVVSLRALGHSTRAIASGLGVDQKTVVNDLTRLSNSGQSAGEESSSPAPVIGLDGKTYPSTKTPAADDSTPQPPVTSPPVAEPPAVQTPPEGKPVDPEAQAAADRATEARRIEQARADALLQRAEALDKAVDFLTEFAEWPERTTELREHYTPLYPGNPVTQDKLRRAADGLAAVAEVWS